MTQDPVLDWSAIDKEALLAAGSPMKGGLGNKTTHVPARIRLLYFQQVLLQPGPKHHVQTLPKAGRRQVLELHPSIQEQRHMDRQRGERQIDETVGNMAHFGGGIFQKLAACWGIIEEIPQLR